MRVGDSRRAAADVRAAAAGAALARRLQAGGRLRTGGIGHTAPCPVFASFPPPPLAHARTPRCSVHPTPTPPHTHPTSTPPWAPPPPPLVCTCSCASRWPSSPEPAASASAFTGAGRTDQQADGGSARRPCGMGGRGGEADEVQDLLIAGPGHGQHERVRGPGRPHRRRKGVWTCGRDGGTAAAAGGGGWRRVMRCQWQRAAAGDAVPVAAGGCGCPCRLVGGHVQYDLI